MKQTALFLSLSLFVFGGVYRHRSLGREHLAVLPHAMKPGITTLTP